MDAILLEKIGSKISLYEEVTLALVLESNCTFIGLTNAIDGELKLCGHEYQSNSPPLILYAPEHGMAGEVRPARASELMYITRFLRYQDKEEMR